MSQLSGDYLIGPSQPSPFKTITTAVNHLNSVGASGPVNFLLDAELYTTASGETFPITINQYPGAGASKPLTIRPNSGKTIIIRADNINNWTPTTAIFKLNGADHVIIDGSNNGSNSQDLTLINKNTLEYSTRAVIWLNSSGSNGANDNTIKNLIIEQQSTQGALSMGIASTGSDLSNQASAANSDNTISNVKFDKAGQGVYINGNGSAANQSKNWTITGCTFGAASDDDKGFMGVYLNNIKDYTISGNLFEGFIKPTYSYNPTIAAIYTTGSCSNGTISHNRINDVRDTVGSTVSGIFITGNQTTVYNNMIGNVRGYGNGGIDNNGYGIVIHSGQNISLYHNTVRMSAPQQTGTSAALRIIGGSALDIRNNIFVNAQSSGGSRYAVYASVTSAAFSSIDYNNYHSTQHIGYRGGTKSNLSQWKSATGKDQHSVSISPSFVSDGDLHLSPLSTSLNNLGVSISSVSDDIDGDLRGTEPDMGADEFELPLCAATTTWNGTSWSNGQPSLTKTAIINGNYTTHSGSLKCCELIIASGKTLTIKAGDYIEVENDITVDGNLIILDKGALIQNDEDAVHNGSITMHRRTTPLKQYDYTYWSSPVIGTQLSILGTPSLYYYFNPAINNYVAQSATNVMMAGRGYIARVPNNLNFSTPQTIEATFNGTPHTGTIAVPVTKGAGSFNLIGNPYPSAINADEFLTDPENASYIGGTIYLWTHNRAISATNNGNNVLNYSRDDYAKYNVTGGVKTGHPAAGTSNAPHGKIASGQGFFIEALENGTHDVFFRNSMRTKGHNGNGQFFRQSEPDEPILDATATIEKHRIWLSISNAEFAYDEMLLGYIDGATLGLDRAYDGKTFPAGNVVSIYSLVDETTLAIQGRGLPFSHADIIPLGYFTDIAGTFNISLESFDGLFANQNVYLYDKVSQTYHDLKLAPFTFTTEATTNNDRFELRFTNETLGTYPTNVERQTVILSDARQIKIRSQHRIKNVEIFDMTGRLLVSDLVESTNYSSNVLDTPGTAVLVIV